MPKQKKFAKTKIVNLDVTSNCMDGYVNERVLDPEMATPELDSNAKYKDQDFLDLYSLSLARLTGEID